MSTADRLVFLSCAPPDRGTLRRLKVHLRPLVRQGVFDVWDNSQVEPGRRWHQEVSNALFRAHVAILLVSADFLASDSIFQDELPPLLHQAAARGLLILPLLISPCLFMEHAELSRYQCVNQLDRPLSSMPPSDAEGCLLSLARSVEGYFRALESQSASPANAPKVRRGTAKPVRSPLSQARSDIFRGNSLVVDRPFNLGFDCYSPDGRPLGWSNSRGYVSRVSTEYGVRLIARANEQEPGSYVVLEREPPVEDEFGALMQRCPADHLAGRTIRVEAELSSENVTEWAGLWVRVDGNTRPNLFFDNMSRRPLVGTTTWKRYFIDALVPGDATWLNYGIVLSGPGRLRADNFSVRVWCADGSWEDV